MNSAQPLQQGMQQGANAAGGNMPQGGPPGGMGGPGGAGGFLPGSPIASIVILTLFAITLVVLAVAFYKLFQKAGFSGAIGLLMLIPVVNLGVALYLAFAEWPVLAELARAKLVAASATQPTAMASTAPPISAGESGPAVPLAT